MKGIRHEGKSFLLIQTKGEPSLDRSTYSCATQCSNEFEPHFAFISQHLDKTVYVHFHKFIMTCTLGIISRSFNLSSTVQKFLS